MVVVVGIPLAKYKCHEELCMLSNANFEFANLLAPRELYKNLVMISQTTIFVFSLQNSRILCIQAIKITDMILFSLCLCFNVYFLYRLNATKLEINLSPKKKKPTHPSTHPKSCSYLYQLKKHPEIVHSPGHTRLNTFLQTYVRGGKNC